MIGSRLGPYEITAKLGEGGMGEVYRASDSRLKREVAIKVLPSAFTADPERLARFEREAQILAQLNHPNIAGIHGIEESGGTLALVMELVEGPTLAERLAEGKLPLEECVTIAVQLARALDAAHEKGVVHRDLKPQNIKIAPDGSVKVLDFGLAKALEPATGSAGDVARSPAVMNSPTLTAAGTQLGVILGTAAYMAPEQARGGAVDKRADIWAFGVVLYEMLSGRRLFTGDSVADTLASVLRADLDFAALPPETPAALKRILSRCLERDPRRRWRDAGDLAIEIADAPRGRGAAEPAVPAEAAAARKAPSRWRGAAALLAALALGAAAMWLARGGAREQRVERPRDFEPKTFGRQRVFSARFMPDGRTIVYGSALAGNRPEIFLLAPGSMAPRKIGPSGATVLSVSSGGELAILTDTTYMGHRVLEGTLARMSVDGAPRALVDSVRDADWAPDGELAIVQRRSGADRLEYPPGKVLYQTTGYVSEPRVSPDGTRIAFLDHPWWIDDRGWVKVVDRAGKVESLAGEYWAVEGLAWAEDGTRLLFSGANGESANMLQARSVALTGGAARIELAAPGELMVVDVAADGRWLAINEDGFYGVAVRRPGGQPDLDLSWLDQSWGASLSRDGQTALFSNGHGGANYTVVTRRTDGSPISTLGEGEALGFSPDGAWVAARIPTPSEIVLYPTGAGAPRRLERGTIESYEKAEWFPDGQSLLLTASELSRPLRAFRQSIDGGPPQAVTPEGIYGKLSPRGDRILAQNGDGNWKVYPLDGGEPRAVEGLGNLEEIAAWSPAGDAVYARRIGEVPMRLERVELSTGKRTPSLVVGPADRIGLVRVLMGGGVLDPDRAFAYEYLRRLSTLYLVSGAKR